MRLIASSAKLPLIGEDRRRAAGRGAAEPVASQPSSLSASGTERHRDVPPAAAQPAGR